MIQHTSIEHSIVAAVVVATDTHVTKADSVCSDTTNHTIPMRGGSGEDMIGHKSMLHVVVITIMMIMMVKNSKNDSGVDDDDDDNDDGDDNDSGVDDDDDDHDDDKMMINYMLTAMSYMILAIHPLRHCRIDNESHV